MSATSRHLLMVRDWGLRAARLTADALFKFAANQKIVLRRHMVLNNTFVIQGEHRLSELDGRLKEVRPVGNSISMQDLEALYQLQQEQTRSAAPDAALA